LIRNRVGYYIHLNDQTTGPFPEDDVRAKLRAGEIKEETLIAKEGDSGWTPLSQTELAQSKIRLKTEARGSVDPAVTPAPASSSSLQFDQAEFVEPKSATITCSICKKPIQTSYYHINRLVACGPCKERIEASGVGRASMAGFGKSVLFGTGAAIAGAVIWYAVRELTGLDLGLIGIAVGLMVGVAVRKGSRGWGGWQYQTLAIVLTYLSIASTYVPPLLKAMQSHRQRSAEQATSETPSTSGDQAENSDDPQPQHKSALAGLPKPLRVVASFGFLLAIACAIPFLAGAQNILGLVIIGIALFQAWKINRRVPLEITGPYKIAPTPGAT
jgi:hypothetical protein